MTLRTCILFGSLLFSSQAISDERFLSCIEGLKSKALEANIQSEIVDQVFSDIKHSPKVIELDRRQPEFSQTFYNYYRLRVTDNRVKKGRNLLKTHADLLSRLERKYGVPAHYLVAFWGMETNFGRYLGKMQTLDSLATLACDERRSEFFTSELLEALHMINSGVVDSEKMQGSWAGAMGNMQFMPSTYRLYGLDADKDGKIDMWNSLDDAFTSAAYYLHQLGWVRGWRWGREVSLPKGFDFSLAGRNKARSLKQWASLGVKTAQGHALPQLDQSAALIVPAGHMGPAFLVYDNFHVIMKWNYSEFYALSVGILANRIHGRRGLKVPPPKAENLSIDKIKSIQKNLKALGFEVGIIDGIFGSQTKAALRAFQKQNGLVADGFPHETVINKILRTAVQPLPN